MYLVFVLFVCFFKCWTISTEMEYTWIWADAAHPLLYCSLHPPLKGKAEPEWKGKNGQQTPQGWYLITIKSHFLADRKLWHTTLKSGNSHFQESIHHLKFSAIISHCNICNTKEHFPKIAGNNLYLQFSPFNCFHCWSYRTRFLIFASLKNIFKYSGLKFQSQSI